MNKQWNSKVQFPSDSDFILRITNASHAPSKSSGNPLLTVEWEVVAPETKDVAGETYVVAGVKSGPMNHLYYTTCTPGDDEKSAANLERLTGDGERKGFLRMCFPDNPELIASFNPETPSPELLNGLKGKLLYAQMSADTTFQRKSPTPAQIEDAKKKKTRAEGDIQVHPVTGAKLVTYLPKVREVFGEAPASALKPGAGY